MTKALLIAIAALRRIEEQKQAHGDSPQLERQEMDIQKGLFDSLNPIDAGILESLGSAFSTYEAILAEERGEELNAPPGLKEDSRWVKAKATMDRSRLN